jgi:hypothetical protein
MARSEQAAFASIRDVLEYEDQLRASFRLKRFQPCIGGGKAEILLAKVVGQNGQVEKTAERGDRFQ